MNGARRQRIGAVLFVLALAGTSCLGPRAATPVLLPAPPEPPAAAAVPKAAPLPPEFFIPYNPTDFLLSVGDVVEVSVFGLADTAATTPVAPDGKLYYLFTEGIPAAGRKPEEVARDVEQRIGRLFNNPRVDILPRRFAANRFLVLGKVNHPGSFPLDSALTVRQAIAGAGGLAQGSYRGTTIEIAALKESYLLRNGRLLPVNFDRLVNGSDSTQDIYVRPGDVIYIASGLSHTREIYLLGAVIEQRAVAYKDNMTLVELIAGASDRGGGYLPAANLRKVIILRGALSKPETLDVDMNAILNGRAPDQYLVPGDIVYVPEKPYRFARDLTRGIVLTFVRAFASEAGASVIQENFFPNATPRTVSSGAGDTPQDTNPELNKILSDQ
jgi:polysaccharide biosynthesis/export protein